MHDEPRFPDPALIDDCLLSDRHAFRKRLAGLERRRKNGQPAHNTTGVASRHCNHCTLCNEMEAGMRSGSISTSMAIIKTGRANTA